MRKKLFAVIMSAMMMITFMPTMAFAANIDVNATKVTWNAANTAASVEFLEAGEKVTLSNVPAALEFDPTDGQTTATLATTYPKNGTDNYVIAFGSGALAGTKAFYDLTNAVIVRSNGTAEYNATINADEYLGLIDQTLLWDDPSFQSGKNVFDLFGGATGGYVKLVKPANATLPTGVTADKAYVLGTTMVGSVEFTAKLPKYEKYQESKNYEVAITAAEKETPTTPVINADKMVSAHNVYIDSSSFSKVGLKLDGSSKEDYEVTLGTALDTAPAATVFDTTYTGAAQKVEVVTKGLTVQYSVDNGTTWTDAAPEMKDLKTTNYKFAIKATNDKNVSKYGKVEVKIHAAKGVLKFKKAKFNFAPKTEVKASDLVEFVAYEYNDTNNTKKVAMNAEDTALVKEAIDKFVVLEDLDLDAPENEVTAKLDFESLEKAAATTEAVYKFCKNYGITSSTTINVPTGYSYVEVNFATMYNDITAANKTVTYKAKKGKLAKTKTYKLKAEADFGTCTFTKMNTKGGSKIKVAKSGKVTIKKGLKKGTYKVKVKVKAPGTKANMYLTVKVK